LRKVSKMTSLIERLKQKGISKREGRQENPATNASRQAETTRGRVESCPTTIGVDLSDAGERTSGVDGAGRSGGNTIAPCRVCGCPYLWQDVYNGPSGPWRCLSCTSPPSETMIARHIDCRRVELECGQSQQKREFSARWETYHLAGDPSWLVTRRRGNAQHACPRNVPLAEWAKTLRTKLITEV